MDISGILTDVRSLT